MSPSTPSPHACLTRCLPNDAATCLLAQQLAHCFTHSARETAPRRGHIHLSGELGSGKTTFVRAFLREIGVPGRIKSPSYALLEPYTLSNLQLYHFDFYRFNDPREWLDIGFRDCLHEEAIVLIEWPERAAGLLPTPDLHIFLAYADSGRLATLTAQTLTGQQWLHAIPAVP